MDLLIEPMAPGDWPAVRAIYEEGIAGGDATFETRAPDWETFDAAHLPACRLVARLGGAVVAWAALVAVSQREVYVGVAEVSIYVAGSQQERGVGRALLAHLIEASEAAGFWTLQAGIFPKNLASIVLHRGAGFRELGRQEQPGRAHGRWRDVVLFERRSRKTGVD